MRIRCVGRGFTFVELLVVIGIIIFLICGLIAAVIGVRAQTQSVACQASLRSIGQAFAGYAAENGGFWPMSENTITSDGVTRTWRWHDYLGTFLGRRLNAEGLSPNEARKLPKDKSPLWGCEVFKNEPWADLGIGYGMNPTPASPTVIIGNRLLTNLGYVGLDPSVNGRFMRQAEYHDPSGRALISEIDPSVYDDHPAVVHCLRSSSGRVETNLDLRRHGIRHKSRFSNTLFCDLHVATGDPETVIQAHLFEGDSR